ncbi:hypothetical protein COCON_G00095300 [Conger conger]|uniref:Uncharacterized protein n=1 Tax=Conger conger TaxID=82655 RepID=A0A9Q1DLU0_CONCO|nr:hypothetical protein COCON_G00095300 [Conger conger]
MAEEEAKRHTEDDGVIRQSTVAEIEARASDTGVTQPPGHTSTAEGLVKDEVGQEAPATPAICDVPDGNLAESASSPASPDVTSSTDEENSKKRQSNVSETDTGLTKPTEDAHTVEGVVKHGSSSADLEASAVPTRPNIDVTSTTDEENYRTEELPLTGCFLFFVPFWTQGW